MRNQFLIFWIVYQKLFKVKVILILMENNEQKDAVKESPDSVKPEHHAVHHERKSMGETLVRNPWIISSVVLGVIVLVLLVNTFSGMTGGVVGVVSESDIKPLALAFFNNQLSNNPGTVVSVEEVSGLYEVVFEIQGEEVPLYFTKDAKWIQQGGILIPILVEDKSPASTEAPVEVPKSDKPKVELFVMSFCPYGNRGEDTMLPVYNLLKEKVEWNINYIVSVSGDEIRSLHGQPETDQDIREVCVKKDFGLDKFWQFVTYVNQNCGSNGDCWEDAAESIGVDTSKIQTCFEEEGLDLMKNEAKISNDAGASGSPTLLINGVNSRAVYQYGNSEVYKQAICSAFTNIPEECNIVLNSTTSANTGGSC